MKELEITEHPNGVVIARNNKRVTVIERTDNNDWCNVEVKRLTLEPQEWSATNFKRGINSLNIGLTRETAFDLFTALMIQYDGFKAETE